ncbi:MAG: bifunctional diguanylate cyclase/phosphodiesterase [Pseudomonadota bacterium]
MHRASSAALAAALVGLMVFQDGQIQLILICGALMVVAFQSVHVVVPLAGAATDQIDHLEKLEKKHSEDMRHDPVTGLPTRAAMLDILDMNLNHASRHGHRVGLCLFHLTSLRRINEIHGRDAGDLALRRAAGIIRTETRKGDYVARIAEHEFVVISSMTKGEDELHLIAERIESRISTPFNTGDDEIEMKCAAGIVRAAANEIDADQLLQDASIALRAARARQTNIITFQHQLREEFDETLRNRADLTMALEKGQVEPWFQPQIDARTGEVVGLEALARWHHPALGIRGPGAFFAIAEEYGLMEKIDKVVLDHSLNALCQWRAQGIKVPRVGVNISAARLRDPFLAEQIKWAIEKYGLEPADLSIEILESALITSEKCQIAKNVRSLSRIGVHLDLDDFGTGHAAISTLDFVEVDRIKIDRSFITGIENSERRQKCLRTMIDLAAASEVIVLVEGVENEAEKACVAEIGCHQMQGYGIAHPMPREKVSTWVEDWTAQHNSGSVSKGSADLPLTKSA